MSERDVTRDEIARRIAEHVDQPWDDPETDQTAAREVADAVMPVVDRLLGEISQLESKLNDAFYQSTAAAGERDDLQERLESQGGAR
ncbi:hypothetical protein [Amycolatopsis japonica]